MKNNIYIDGFLQVNFIGGMVRISSYILLPADNNEEEPKQEENAQLIMSPQAFVDAFSAMQQLAEKLSEAGILKKN